MERTVNKVELNGYLGNDPVLFTIAGGYKKANISIATRESYKNKDGEWVNNSSWHNVVFWNKQAEQAVNELKKGMRISLEGKISYRRFTGKDGLEKFFTEIIAAGYKIIPLEEKVQ